MSMIFSSPTLEQTASLPRRWPEYLRLQTVVLFELLTAGLNSNTDPALLFEAVAGEDVDDTIHRRSHTVTPGSSVEPPEAK